MNFYTVRDLRTTPKSIWENLSADGEVIITNNGRPTAILFDIADGSFEEILLQGVVDCCFETADGLTVVDFKTDRVFSALEVRQRAEHYRPQLEAYSRALERVLEKKVVRRALYFLAAGETMEI